MIWDTTADQAADPATVALLRTGFAAAPIVAVLGFPRPDEIAAARRAGVAQVVSKPYLLADLQRRLNAAVDL